MVFITEDLIRKRSEHNNSEICTLEELSLHQCDVERIEYLDKWCRELKILYLQSNLIPRIENVSRLKKLEYLNLALNNITLIENVDGCESLKKLDLTVNFVAKVTSSIENLCSNKFLRELYLTGNPCTEYVGYRDYVIATLPQLASLDGKEISKSERIQALQHLTSLRCDMLQQEKRCLQKLEKEQQQTEEQENAKKTEKDNNNEEITADDDFWSRPTKYTPESRLETHRYMEEKRKEKEDSRSGLSDFQQPFTRVLRFFTEEGRPLNINQDHLKFSLTEDEDLEEYVLDVACYKHIDTSLMDVDVQPNYVRVNMKGKILQLALHEEVSPDSSSAKRSQTTGHLVVTMPKLQRTLNNKIKAKKNVNNNSTSTGKKNPREKPVTNCGKPNNSVNSAGKETPRAEPTTNCNKLEVNATQGEKLVDIYNIVKHPIDGEETREKKDSIVFCGKRIVKSHMIEDQEDDFTDDDEVPPLE